MYVGDKEVELPYVRMLNAVLPSEIRVLSWAPVEANFSARFSCIQRTYKYFFPRSSLNIQVSVHEYTYNFICGR